MKSRNLRILVIDDIWSFAELVLKEVGFEVVVERDGDEALRSYLEEGHYDVVLTDLEHPGLSGYDLVKAILKENPRQAMAVLTAHFEWPEVPVPVLQKPFQMQELLDLIKSLTGVHKVLSPTLYKQKYESPN
jgi:CheY-like chemotaxis protein